MHAAKKTLKLSRKHSEKLGKADAPLDDSLDDFIVTRPLRAERKAAKCSTTNNQLLNTVHPMKSTLTANTCQSLIQNFSESDLVNSNQCNEKQESYCEDDPSCSKKSLLQTSIQNNDVSKAISPQLQQDKNKRSSVKRSSRRKAIDPSDLSLALALSESIQLANECARKKEEELLLNENLVEMLADLRSEEQTSGALGLVISKPAEGPVTKVKRKAKATAKKEPVQYTLLLRSEAERKRINAERATTVLIQEVDDLLKPKGKSFFNCRPVSEFLRKHSQNDNALWQRASLSDTDAIEQPDIFYVDALRTVISPQKKKSGYTNILFHVSQLPGRNSSQIDPGPSHTQVLLEELAFAAEGGFVDEPNICDNSSNEDPRAKTAIQLAEDWSLLVDNPMMSDLTIKTQNKDIKAHRLVIAIRAPLVLDRIIKQSSDEKFVLDWSRYSSSSILRVLRFIYSASYEHDEEDACFVYRIARNYQIKELLGLLPHRFDEDSISSCNEDNSLEDTSDTSPNKSLKTPEQVAGRTEIRSSFSQKKSLTNLREDNKKKSFSPSTSNPSPSVKIDRVRPRSLEQVSDREEITVLDESKQTTPNAIHSANFKDSICMNSSAGSSPNMLSTLSTPSSALNSSKNRQNVDISEKRSGKILVNENIGSNRSAKFMSAIDMEISNGSNSTDKTVPLSPDMFHETLSDVEEEVSKSQEDVIDLTQGSSDRSSVRSPSPCEEKNSSREDVSMVDYSIVSDPKDSPLKSPSTSMRSAKKLQHSLLDASVSSRAVNESVASWNCYSDGIIEGGYDSPLATKNPSPKLRSPEQVTHPQNQFAQEEFPDELDSVFSHDVDPSPVRPMSVPSRIVARADVNTPEGPRQAKKRKIDVTPLPDYQSMETPLLKQELMKYGLKPFPRPNAVKLLKHIYEELHPFVTDSESSFQETPERPTTSQYRITNPSPSKSAPSTTSCEESESGLSQEDEESMIAMELDKEMSSQANSPRKSVPLKDQMKEFLRKHPDIYKSVLTYEPISFEYLFKEVRKERIRCKAQDLLDWADEECVTCQMKSRNRPAAAKRDEESDHSVSPPKRGVSSAKPKTRVAKKLIS